MTHSAANLPPGASFNASTKTFTWTPSYTQSGSYTNVHLEVSDGSLTDSEDITITVVNVNRPPEASISTPATGSTFAPFQSVSFDASQSSDADGDVLTYEWTSSLDGVFSTAQKPSAILSPGTHTVTLKASDGKGGVGSTTIEVVVGAITASNVPSLTPPQPPASVKTKALQDWYVLERARLATVYLGVVDSNPENHRGWANTHDDLTLYNEVITLRNAFAQGVTGSLASPFQSFLAWVDYQKASWVPSGGLTTSNAPSLTPSKPLAGYKLKALQDWYVLERARLATVYFGGVADPNPENHRYWANTHDDLTLYNEAMALRDAFARGVVGSLASPFQSFLAWAVYQPKPLAGYKSKALQDWYVLERARLATVYFGVADANPENHRNWANTHDDLTLYNEIILMRQAFSQSVVGSLDKPFQSFLAWLDYIEAHWVPAGGITPSNAPSLTPPKPQASWEIKPVQDWYVLERARLATVYFGGVADPNPENHRYWANAHDDLTLYNEIILMRQAFAQGVVGSLSQPFQSFLAWLKNK